MAGTKSFERFCRLCAKEQEVTVMLFNQKAEDMLLIKKIQKYLLIEIDENSKLSKNICITCCSQLENLCNFIELVRKAQKTLHALCGMEDSCSPMLPLKEENMEYTEICIDPMDILKNMPDESCTEQVEQVPWQDDTVTLKRIPKEDDEDNSDEGKGKKRFKCDVCDKSFLVEQSLKNHSWIHLQEDYSCFTCQRSFRLQSDLEKHMKAHKPVGFKFNCNICGRRFKTDISYETHMHIHNSASSNAFTCKVCGRFYSNWAGLKIHSITHSSEKPFHCTLCEKKFKRNQELKFHMNYHTGAKPYKCKYCEKAFASTGNLYSHKNRCHKNSNSIKCQDNSSNNVREETKKRFKCHICKKRCARQENYTYHVYLHTGEKPFKCMHCHQKFITKRSLSIHYDRIHPGANKPPIHLPVFCPIKSKWIHNNIMPD